MVKGTRHGFTRLKGGTLYPLLKRLEDHGLVEHTWQHDEAGPGRKQFTLTEQGAMNWSARQQPGIE